jgi:hypothetical protein
MLARVIAASAPAPRPTPSTPPPARDAPRTRPVERLVIHGEPVDFRELCRRAVPSSTRYLVLDLDRTLHLGRNMGELLGWEVGARHAYGAAGLAAAEPRRRPGRFFLDARRPLALLRYLLIGLRMWALPGLFYLLFCKVPERVGLLRRFIFRRFGSEPVAAVQRVPQTALLHHLAALPAAELRLLARRVWDRHAADLVIEREDVAWLRERCPGIRIVIASASPEPSVAVAAEALGLDDVVCSTVEEHEGWFSAPFRPPLSLLRRAPPRRLSGPAKTRINSSRAKIENLWARHPALADPATLSVGISDTGYGEDHCWLDHFTRVVDVNSSAPFPPFVSAGSPLREVHSAAVLTRAERARRAAGDARHLDARRPLRDRRDREFTAAELAARLAPLAAEVERLARSMEERETDLAPARARLRAGLEAFSGRIEALVAAFNAAAARERRAALAPLRDALRGEGTLRRELTRLERPLAELSCALSGLLAAARGALAGPEPRARR